MDAASYTVFACPGCEQRLRVPNDRGKLTLTCPKCLNRYDYSPTVIGPPLHTVGLSEVLGLPVPEANKRLASAYFRCISPYAAKSSTYINIKRVIAKSTFDFVFHFQSFGRLKDCKVPGLAEKSLAILEALLRHGVDGVYERMSKEHTKGCGKGDDDFGEHSRDNSDDGNWDAVVRAWEEK